MTKKKKATGRGGARAGSGRPQKHGEGRTVPKTVTVPESLWEAAKTIAEGEGSNFSTAVVDGLRLYVAKHRRKTKQRS